MERARRLLAATTVAAAAFLLVWWGLASGWHWSRGDAIGLAAAVMTALSLPLGWWVAQPLKSGSQEEGGPKYSVAAGSSGPGSRSDPVRFGAIPVPLRIIEPREGLLNLLRASAGANPVTVVCAVTGLRGVGKTQLAAEYARDRIDAGWSLVAWIDAEQPTQMIEQLVSLSERLGLRRSENEDAAVVTARLHDWLQARTEPALLIFDNAINPDTILPHLPAVGGTHTLITSTEQAFTALGKPIDVQPFSTEQSVNFLHRATGQHDPKGAHAVAEELGCLPLALAHAATLISRQGLNYPTYLQRLRNLSLREYLPRPFSDPYPFGTVSAILLSLDSVELGNSTTSCAQLIEVPVSRVQRGD
jgi:hypothetical protein